MPPNMLKARVGGRFAGIDMAAIKRAETAVAELAPEFSDWISKDTLALRSAYVAYRKRPDTRSRTHLNQTANALRITFSDTHDGLSRRSVLVGPRAHWGARLETLAGDWETHHG